MSPRLILFLAVFLLNESDQRERVAEGLYRGIAAYLDNLRSLRHKKQKLVSENRPSTPSGFATTTATIGRLPR